LIPKSRITTQLLRQGRGIPGEVLSTAQRENGVAGQSRGGEGSRLNQKAPNKVHSEEKGVTPDKGKKGEEGC